MSASGEPLKCLVLPLAGTGVLLPGVLAAEIITQQDVNREGDRPDWFLGTGTWRGVEVPLIAFDRLCGLRDEIPDPAGRYVMVYAHEAGARPAYYGIRIDGLPRSETLTPDRIDSQEQRENDPEYIAFRVRHGDRESIVPDLDALLRTLAQYV